MNPPLHFFALHPHPLSPAAPVHELAVALRVAAGGGLTLRYRLHGDPARLRIPAPLPAAPADGLWMHTCFELFAAAAGTDAYREFNFSPSGQWAAYAFRSYRERDARGDPAAAPAIALQRDGATLELDVRVPALALPAAASGRLMVGVAAVVEELDGTLSYWALHHPVARPDFHHPGGFVLRIPYDAPLPRPAITTKR
jgi:hypothetical protein